MMFRDPKSAPSVRNGTVFPLKVEHFSSVTNHDNSLLTSSNVPYS